MSWFTASKLSILGFSFLNDQRSHVVSSLFVVFCVSSVTEWELFGPPTTAVYSFVSQILHVKRMDYLGVIFLDVKVDHRFAASISAIKFSVG